MKTKEQLARIDKSIALQRRTLANLEGMELADAGKTIELTKQIIATLEARRGLIAPQFRIGQRVRTNGSSSCPPRTSHIAETITNSLGRLCYILADGGMFAPDELHAD